MLTSPTNNKPPGAYLQMFVFLIVHLMLKYRASKANLSGFFSTLLFVCVYILVIEKENYCYNECCLKLILHVADTAPW